MSNPIQLHMNLAAAKLFDTKTKQSMNLSIGKEVEVIPSIVSGENCFEILPQSWLLDNTVLGNSLYKYATMRSIAEKHGLNIPHLFPDFFKKPTKYPKTDIKKIFRIGDENIAQILTIDPEPQVSFYPDPQTFLQCKESSYNIQEFIKEWLVDDTPEDSEGIVIHYRLGDLVHNEQGSEGGRVVKMEYFEKAIESIPNYQQYNRYITSDSPQDNRVKHIIDKYGFELYNSRPEETIKFCSQFSHKILSLGTFRIQSHDDG